MAFFKILGLGLERIVLRDSDMPNGAGAKGSLFEVENIVFVSRGNSVAFNNSTD
jgi:hypothetical protein